MYKDIRRIYNFQSSFSWYRNIQFSSKSSNRQRKYMQSTPQTEYHNEIQVETSSGCQKHVRKWISQVDRSSKSNVGRKHPGGLTPQRDSRRDIQWTLKTLPKIDTPKKSKQGHPINFRNTSKMDTENYRVSDCTRSACGRDFRI